MKVEIITADLGKPDAARGLWDAAIAGGPIDILINNAGVGYFHRFDAVDWARDAELVQLNVTSLVQLARCFVDARDASTDARITELVTDELEQSLPDATRPSLSNSSTGNVLALAAVPRTRRSAANRTAFAGSAARPVASRPRQKHQVGRFLGVCEERLARRSHLRAHRQTAGKVDDLARAHGYGKVRRDFSRADPVLETTFHHRHAASRSVL